ncbi:MAG: tRNA (adenosine(37)-N6)-dimethylallyltransferase MiaA [Salegentibacter sp.]|uniref:tRNA (adenosine(37)-N6)-dimethylallyltransferase MiaA n=1 Tax=Salegentibacter sp. TaxID=1903072 RepID=UPI00287047EB|nr:tRNA (adenosine(37)-N6)-dimethylallyltransferase MiaA [Salegentibacter sp.]MDR9458291.1 tRNA (adenosine(37)-N6)-dimethylallyltransferase MiaA [Salegentibacter sp.]
MSTNFLITVSGPTAIGKTALAIKLAQHFNTEIISADSRQFFKEMRIGTAVPSEEELAAVPHHFIQHISVEDNYSVGDFERQAISKLGELFREHQVVVMVGGSGLYVKAILEGLDDFPEIDPGIREELNVTYETNGIEPLQQQLKELDPKYYEVADIQNPHRLIRALEICIGSGKTYSSFLNRKKPERNFKAINIGLETDREIIYDRINRRVDLMMDEGLLEEAEKLFPKRRLNALNTVGYKELFDYLKGIHSLETAVVEIKKNTRRFAKRQLTWFRKQEQVRWFDYKTSSEKIIEYIENKISEKS